MRPLLTAPIKLGHGRFLIPLLLATAVAGCGQDSANEPGAAPAKARPAADVDGARIIKADQEGHNWMSHGRSYDEQRHSPLKQINTANVGKLGLAWQFKLDVDRGTEATPIVVDGVMYTTGAFSIVYALDARSGELLWKYDPQVEKAVAGKGCCGPVNRGVAVWQGKVYVGAYDGRLIALDASSGKPVWSTQTVDSSQNYTVTGAPRIIKGQVIIGNGGAELGVRGYVSAYDAGSGELNWRFYTVPGDPAQPPEDAAMKLAKPTWFGDSYHQGGGGGTVWDSMAYDPELDLLYIGTGNGSPWNIKYRSEGKGDNLFLSSIVALRPQTGEYVWHYQTTPGDTWDYTATQHIVLADLQINGKLRKVAMQAPKNGYFYVLDRKTGELISAKNFVPTNWASHVDLKTGRPVLTGEADYSSEPKLVTPSAFGAHNWQPMSYNPETGLVYIPAQITAMLYEDFGQRPAVAPNLWNVGVAPLRLPDDAAALAAIGEQSGGSLLAWDPVTQQARWEVPYDAPWNGGTLSTAGNLVFQGTADGRVVAYGADSGELLWQSPANTGVIAAPMSYSVDGEQYVSFMAGWGGTFALVATGALEPQIKLNAEARVLTYKIGGKQKLPPPANKPVPLSEPPELQATAEHLAIGKDIYHGVCASCHGIAAVGNGLVPDLRYMNAQTHAQFQGIVAGALAKRGMPAFGHVLPPEQVELVHQYLIKRAQDVQASINARGS